MTLWRRVGTKRWHIKQKNAYRALCGVTLEVPSKDTLDATTAKEVTCCRCRNWLYTEEGAEYRRELEGAGR